MDQDSKQHQQQKRLMIKQAYNDLTKAAINVNSIKREREIAEAEIKHISDTFGMYMERAKRRLRGVDDQVDQASKIEAHTRAVYQKICNENQSMCEEYETGAAPPAPRNKLSVFGASPHQTFPLKSNQAPKAPSKLVQVRRGMTAEERAAHRHRTEQLRQQAGLSRSTPSGGGW